MCHFSLFTVTAVACSWHLVHRASPEMTNSKEKLGMANAEQKRNFTLRGDVRACSVLFLFLFFNKKITSLI